MNKKIAASAAALVALGVASGTAFTNSLTVTTKTAGFGSTDVSSVTMDNIVFTYNNDGSKILSAVVLLPEGAANKHVTLKLIKTDDTTLAGPTTQVADPSGDATFLGLTVDTIDLKTVQVAVTDDVVTNS